MREEAGLAGQGCPWALAQQNRAPGGKCAERAMTVTSNFVTSANRNVSRWMLAYWERFVSTCCQPGCLSLLTSGPLPIVILTGPMADLKPIASCPGGRGWGLLVCGTVGSRAGSARASRKGTPSTSARGPVASNQPQTPHPKVPFPKEAGGLDPTATAVWS